MEFKEIILIKNGELSLKGLNRNSFENRLIKNIKRVLSDLGSFSYKKSQSTICIEPENCNMDLDKAASRLKKIFGIAAFSVAAVVDKDMEQIKQAAPIYLEKILSEAKTFKILAKRSDKKFPLTSPEIAREIGATLLSHFPHLKVDMSEPEVTVRIEIRDFGCYIHSNPIPGAGGLPVGTSGKAAVLISGGIDSPVAGYMMAKRGLELVCIHFASPPYTSQRARLKVEGLVKKLAAYAGRIKLIIVPFTEIQEQIKLHCPEDLSVVIMRRFMMKLSQQIAVDNDCGALITGESLAQVASQTLQAINCTDSAVSIPVFRPLIGMDKEEIIDLSKKMDAFEISIQPYEDCCTIFTPKHPRTRPNLEQVLKAEQKLDQDYLIDKALSSLEIEIIEREL